MLRSEPAKYLCFTISLTQDKCENGDLINFHLRLIVTYMNERAIDSQGPGNARSIENRFSLDWKAAGMSVSTYTLISRTEMRLTHDGN